MSGQWQTSLRSAELPTNWPKLRAQVRKRDHNVCQWPVNDSICGAPGDGGVDHREGRSEHHIDALWLLCNEHHGAKTQDEALAGRVFVNRPPERHPGLL